MYPKFNPLAMPVRLIANHGTMAIDAIPFMNECVD
jgi:hypothetical protein